ncbi:hypothetical protein GCM10012275_05980 [Longimycelium tulufanense]|uniref:SRPBCC family protein n=1 Tax=Longimycelium tulufanense TaxID=907463 RepID=A0A8J3FUS0_9PSEU|nr:SRPBCC family protein [Longimycelium tulufanense]GGM37735.1 hypothetical protein GCM10012275_05980 [Longimycelium tulufanense]
MVHNVHSRELPLPAREAAPLVDEIAEPQRSVWPAPQWPPLLLDRPLGVGAAGGHGLVRYTCSRYEPGRRVEFTFARSVGIEGTHSLEILDGPAPGTCVLRHEIRGTCRRAMVLLWPLVVRWMHDALLEDLLDRAERVAGRAPERPARWSPWVRLLHALARRVEGGQPAERAGG